MNLHRNVLAIVAGAALMASLPAGAQLLGGSVDGAVNGTIGGSVGRVAKPRRRLGRRRRRCLGALLCGARRRVGKTAARVATRGRRRRWGGTREKRIGARRGRGEGGDGQRRRAYAPAGVLRSAPRKRALRSAQASAAQAEHAAERGRVRRAERAKPERSSAHGA